MTINETLQKIAEQASKRGKSLSIAGPWLIDIPPHGNYALASDSRSELFINAFHPGLTQPVEPMSTAALKYADGHRSFFPHPEQPPHGTTTASELQTWSGPVEWTQPCPECKGTSKNSDYVSCAFCDDDGEMESDLRPGYLFDVPINRVLLARLLAPFAPADVVKVYVGSLMTKPVRETSVSEKLLAVWVVNEQWRCVLIGLTLDHFTQQTEEWQNAPRFT